VISIGGHTHRPNPIQTIEENARRVAPVLDGAGQQVAGSVDVARVVRRDAVMQTFVGLTLSFGERTSRALDICASAIMVPIEEHNTRPYTDRALVLPSEIVIKS
jgi:hypothetical protein